MNRIVLFPLSLVLLLGWSNRSFGQGDSCSVAEVLMVSNNTTLNLNANGPSTGTGTTLLFGERRSADWYVFTAPADGFVNLTSCGGGADTYLRVHTGVCDSLDMVAEADEVCDQDDLSNNNNNFRAAAIFGLQVEAGKTYYVEWAGIWDPNPFSWSLTFVNAQADGEVIGGVPFTRIPFQQAEVGFAISGRVLSNGPLALTGASLEARVNDQQGNLIQSGIVSVPVLEAQNDTTLEVFTWAAVAEGFYQIEYILKGGTNGFADNDTFRVELEVSSVTYSVAEIHQAVANEITQNNLEQGQVFDFFANDTIRVVSAQIFGGKAGEDVQIFVYDFEGGEPGAQIASSDRISLTQAGQGKVFFNLSPDQGGLPVSAGKQYLFSLVHFAPLSSSIQLGKNEEFFFPGRVWIRSFQASQWTLIESIDKQQSLSIQLSNDFRSQQLSVSVDMADLLAGGANIDQVSVLWKVDDGEPQLAPMEANGDSTFTAGLPVKSLDQVSYFFVNGDGSQIGQYENVPGACGQTVNFSGNDRLARTVSMGFSDTEVEVVCFSSCDNCNGFPCGSPTSIICDNLESYELGAIGPQSPHWTNLQRSNEGLVISGEASSGDKSMLIDGTIAGQDVLLLLDDQTTGAYELSWLMYKPAGKRAYYNIQHAEAFGNFAAVAFFLEGGQGNFRLDPDAPEPLVFFDYPENTWFEVRHVFDLELGQARLYVNGQAVFAWDFSVGSSEATTQLGAINFFPFNIDYRFYVDDVFFQEISSGVENDICTFSADINPLFGGALDQSAFSAVQDNSQAGSDSFDPTDGTACLDDNPNPLDNTLWYTFTGDGERYRIATVECTASPYAANTQLALYTGQDCNNLSPVVCGEGETAAGEILFDTEMGTEYFLLVDGFNANGFPTRGQYCLEVVKTEDEITSTQLPEALEALTLFPNPATDQVTLELQLNEITDVQVDLYNLQGQRVWGRSLNGARQNIRENIDVSRLSPGLYQFRIVLNDQLTTRKLMVR